MVRAEAAEALICRHHSTVGLAGHPGRLLRRHQLLDVRGVPGPPRVGAVRVSAGSGGPGGEAVQGAMPAVTVVATRPGPPGQGSPGRPSKGSCARPPVPCLVAPPERPRASPDWPVDTARRSPAPHAGPASRLSAPPRPDRRPRAAARPDRPGLRPGPVPAGAHPARAVRVALRSLVATRSPGAHARRAGRARRRVCCISAETTPGGCSVGEG